jgi:hypothetical protein
VDEIGGWKVEHRANNENHQNVVRMEFAMRINELIICVTKHIVK